MSEAIIEALKKLDHANDEQWNSDLSPKVMAIAQLGNINGLTRKEITDAAPMFKRHNPVFPGDEVKEPETGDGKPNTDSAIDPPTDEPTAPDIKPDIEPQVVSVGGDAAQGVADAVDAIAQAKGAEFTGLVVNATDDELKAHVAFLETGLADIQDKLNEFKRAEANVLKKLDLAIVEREKRKPKSNTMDAILHYQRQQNKAREDRAARMRGVPLNAGAKSPIDAALGYKPNRQQQRPANIPGNVQR